jgi:hypothetical protein
MQGGGTTGDRLRELAAKIALEQDHDKFSALIKELDELLDEHLPKEPRKSAAGA